MVLPVSGMNAWQFVIYLYTNILYAYQKYMTMLVPFRRVLYRYMYNTCEDNELQHSIINYTRAGVCSAHNITLKYATLYTDMVYLSWV
jgi:hypothetical protein